MEAQVERREGRLAVLSPAVGVFHAGVEEGMVVGAGAPIGRLEVLGSRRELRLPAAPPASTPDPAPPLVGRVVRLGRTLERVRAVEYGETLFLLDPLEPPARPPAGRPAAAAGRREAASSAAAAGGAARGLTVRAFSSGIFYRRPSPSSPPYVEAGEEVEAGRVLGLIEVMKSFHRVLFEGEGFGAAGRGVVSRILAEDGQEVESGQPLFLVRPVRRPPSAGRGRRRRQGG